MLCCMCSRKPLLSLCTLFPVHRTSDCVAWQKPGRPRWPPLQSHCHSPSSRSLMHHRIELGCRRLVKVISQDSPVAGDFCCNAGKPVSAAQWPARIKHLSLAALVPPEHILLVAVRSLHKRSTHPTPRPREFTQPSTAQEQYRSTQHKKKLQHSSSKIVLSEHRVRGSKRQNCCLYRYVKHAM